MIKRKHQLLGSMFLFKTGSKPSTNYKFNCSAAERIIKISDNVTKGNQSVALSQLHPAQRFMYEFGCFVTFWGNFEMYMEVVIWRLSNDNPIENCRKINKKTAGGKCKVLRGLLQNAGKQDVIDALDQVFDVAERNDWIHGGILNPDGDFCRLTLFRVHHNKNTIVVKNCPVDLSKSPFDEFYQVCTDFEKIVESTFAISRSDGDDYIKKLQAKQC